ncbi:hypothetical protein [Dysgonomonas sp. BGC7]|uniref:hypothetical protein n=1 Tax=Dysgonomonas sp. BGC7 TaxID=1658008 RepID=UPI0006826E9D|nr:hypothetical protein [Dysgonomonas sp. BGC7]MBD8389667.1 hypothetical protein [Dysgonomonas sp. BGC7]
MKKILLLLFIFPLFIACSSDDDDNKYYWEVYISNRSELHCSPSIYSEILAGYPTISPKTTEIDVKGRVEQSNKDWKYLYDKGEIDCLPIIAYRKADK